jgi:hypothetical protein
MLEIIEAKKLRVFKEPGANEEEMQQRLGMPEVGAPIAKIILARLESDGRIEKRTGEDLKSYYLPVW